MSSGIFDEAEGARLHSLSVVGILGKPYGSIELIAAIEDAKSLPFPPA